MTTTFSRGRKFVAILLAASVLGAAAVPTVAFAKGGRHGHGHGHGSGAGVVGAAALLFGAIAASNAAREEEPECRIEKRRVLVAGKPRIRTVRVCE